MAGSKTILCIEDEHFISELYTRALTKAGFKVNVVNDGEAGYQLAATNEFDVILLDIMLPSMTGYDLLRRLRQEVPNLNARVVIATNLEQDDDKRKELEDLSDGYLIKAEHTPKELVAEIQKALQ